MRDEERHQWVMGKAQLLLGLDPIYIDTETTGFEVNDVVVEVAVLDTDGSLIFKSMVKPNRPIPHQATLVHGITDEMVTSAPSWQEVWQGFKLVVEGRVAGFYNAEFDLRMLKQSCQMNGVKWEYPFQDDFCVMELFAQFYGQWDTRRNKYRWQNLATAGKYFQLAEQNRHRAADDALLTKLVLEKMAGWIQQ